MPARSLFPRWYDLSELQEERWTPDVSPLDDGAFFEFLISAEDDQSRTSRVDRKRFFALSEAIELDILDLQARTPQICNLINLHYLQFEVSIAPIKRAINAGEMHLAHDWILNGVSDEITDAIAREFFLHRIYDFLETPIDWIVKNRTNSLLEWFSSFFYYCRARGALHETAEGLIYAAIKVIDSNPDFSGPKLETFRFLLDWASAYNHPIAPHISHFLEELFENHALPLSERTKIAISFSTTADRFTRRSAKEWAEWALVNAREHLFQHEPYQLLITTVETEIDWQNSREEILQALGEYTAALRVSDRSPTNTALVIGQRSQLFNTAVFLLHRFNRRDDLLRMLCIWYDIEPSRRLQSDVLFILPNHGFGMAYLGDGAQLIEDQNRGVEIVKIHKQTNRALNITLTVQGEVFSEEVPARPGVPNYVIGHEFEQAISRHYQFDQLNPNLHRNAKAMVSFPAYPHPIQSLMRSTIGTTFPITASLEIPEPDRAITHAGIWCAGNELFCRMEAEAIEGMLGEAGINAQTYYGDENSKEEFLRFYGTPQYDLVWVIGHGNYDHWDPFSPAVVAGDGYDVTIDEFLKCDFNYSNRRLLVLNICDGGVASVLGGIQKLGLAPMLASSKQATLAHLWPVNSRVAAAYGLLLAHELSSGHRSFFQSFETSLDRLKRPWQEISDKIADIAPGELADRFKNFDPDMNNIFHWGSPCFFQ